MQIILGSGSPRRRQLVALLGLDVAVRVADVDEESVSGATPAADALVTAQLKVQAIVDELLAEGVTDFVVIGSDTNVALGERILQKPLTEAEADAMLRSLRGVAHQVHTAIVVRRFDGVEANEVSTSDVFMRDYDDAEIAAYIATGDPMDKAGAYAIQHATFVPVARWEGCFAGIMGLSLCTTARLLRSVGVAVSEKVPDQCPADCYRRAEYDPRYEVKA